MKSTRRFGVLMRLVRPVLRLTSGSKCLVPEEKKSSLQLNPQKKRSMRPSALTVMRVVDAMRFVSLRVLVGAHARIDKTRAFGDPSLSVWQRKTQFRMP